jgi:UDP-N-acetylmuramoyl-tripeptide--D-alanyl-D-alanine ligase
VVLEMGMNVPGEIRRLTEIAQPDVGLITNIQNVHLEGLGNLERLQEEKGELFRRMRRDGTIVVNQDDPRVIELANRYPGQRITFGTEHPAEVMAKEIRLRGAQGTAFTLLLEGEALEIQLPLLGRQFVPDALCAVAVACLFGVEVQQIKAALEHFHPFPMRMEVVPLKGGATLINDAYNASPYSTELALETLAGARGQGRAIAVLGDMLELGSFTKEAHEQIGKKVNDLSIDLLFALGDEASTVVASAVRHGFPTKNARVAGSHSEAVSLLRENIQNGDWILVKGSRRMSMEKIVESLVKGRA